MQLIWEISSEPETDMVYTDQERHAGRNAIETIAKKSNPAILARIR
jgi:hypothetical protein